jgi:hypothetical protein
VTDFTPAELLLALREVVKRERVVEGSIVLTEDGKRNTCPPINVSYRGEHWALRVSDNDHLKLLAGAPQDIAKSFCKLPDYLIFAEPTGRKRQKNGPDLFVVVCELKSSEGGVAAGAKRQVQLGKFLAKYLIELGLFAIGKADQKPDVEIVGVILSPLRTKRGTTPDEQDEGRYLDNASSMWMYPRSSDDDLRVEELFR